ncbi:MAG: prepilin-type N-terminal cleavage/methylation domain-containing protein [Candidatus Microsaccharimonas sp.]
MRKRIRQLGFTIVELLVVIVVIGILAALTVVAYNGVTNQTKVSVVKSGLSSASKKIVNYATENNDFYPTTLAVLGIINSSDTSYQYSVSNTGTTKSYCLTITVQNLSYFQNNTTNTTPTEGACTGHASNGGLAPNLATNGSFETASGLVTTRTNLLVDPRAEGATGWNFYAGPSQSLTQTNPVASWSQSGKARRGTWTTYSGSGGGFEIPSTSILKNALITAGANNPVTYRVRITASTNGMTIGTPGAPTTTGTLTILARSRTSNITAVAGTVYDDWITVSSPDPSALSSDARIYFSIGPQAVGNYFEASDGDLYIGSYDANRTLFSGASSASGDFSYAWTGTANASTSIETAPNIANYSNNGSGSVRFQSDIQVSSGVRSGRVLVNSSTAINPGLYQSIILPGGTYTFISKVWVEAGFAIAVGMTAQSSTGITLANISGYSSSTLVTGQWVELRRLVTTTSNANVNFFVYAPGTGAVIGKSFWVDEFAIVNGNCTTTVCY